ncbi:MAG TPA: tRNA (guanosine(37)-N1)-methyltransferase TrmD [Elusimicrobiota bacterium]|nr:tRNA (guanosine(37)-N1)-methyltransferase TrmD [Elusimicrobiota bacterium]
MKPKSIPLRIDVLTIFPRMFPGVFSESLLGKAQHKGLVRIAVHDIRDHTEDRHRSVDDRPYGGGPGMVLKPEPVFRALKATGAMKKRGKKPFVVYLSPQGKPLTQKLAGELRLKKHLIVLCGHYEGIDERLLAWVDMEVSVGEAVYTGGEIPAMALVDAVTRTLPGVVKEADSLFWDSFADGWRGRLDCPHYTRPAAWRGRTVPSVLLSGDHKAIQRWRQEQSLKNTRKKRPDLL